MLFNEQDYLKQMNEISATIGSSYPNARSAVCAVEYLWRNSGFGDVIKLIAEEKQHNLDAVVKEIQAFFHETIRRNARPWEQKEISMAVLCSERVVSPDFKKYLAAKLGMV